MKLRLFGAVTLDKNLIYSGTGPRPGEPGRREDDITSGRFSSNSLRNGLVLFGVSEVLRRHAGAGEWMGKQVKCGDAGTCHVLM